MAGVALAIFIVSFVWLGYVYVGYPCVIWLLGQLRPFIHHPRDDYFPMVSVLIAARNEEKDIARKIEETFTWDWPADRLEVLVASDASNDATDEILGGIIDPRLHVLRLGSRVGKNEALNRIASIARGDIFFFTDANTHIPPNCLRRLTRHFADPRVGCVTGVEQTIEPTKNAIVPGSRAHFEYEATIVSLESRLGSVLVCDGSIFCIRGKLYHRLQPDLANDLELPIHIGAQGWGVLYEPEARSTEPVTTSLREEFNRRRRICGQGALAACRLQASMRGMRGWQFFSRKVLRWFGAIPLLLLLVSTTVLTDKPIFAFILFLQLFLYGLAVTGAWRSVQGKTVSPLLALPLYVVLGHIGSLVGVLESLAGRRFGVWEIPSHSRGQKEAI